MNKWSLNSKIILILSIFILGSVAISYMGYVGMKSMNESLGEIVNKNSARVRMAQELKSNFTTMVLNEKNFILEKTKDGMQVYKERIDKSKLALNDTISKMESISTPIGKKNLLEFKAFVADWEVLNKQIQDLSLADQNEKAFELSSTKSRVVRINAEGVVKTIIERNLAMMNTEIKNADELYKTLTRNIIVLSISAIGFGLTLAFFVMKAVSKAIDQVILNLTDSSGQVTSAAHQIAASAEELSSSVTEL